MTKQRKVTKLERAIELYASVNGDRKSTIKLLMDNLKMTEAGASTYHYNIKKALIPIVVIGYNDGVR